MNRRLPLILISALLVAAEPNKDGHGHHKALPHPNDPVLRAEHMDLLALVPDAAVSHTAIRDGAWSDKNTWKDGRLPAADANVLIPKGKTVTLDHVSRVALRTVRIDGKLQFSPDRNTALLVDTLVVMPEGCLLIGTPTRPIAAGKQARLIFADRGPLDTRWDPTQLSRGLISHGIVKMHGAAKTAHVALARIPQKGDTRLILAQKPTNWKKGDRLILPSTTLRGEDEERTILAINGTEVTVAALDHDHAVPAKGLSVPVANVSRNVIVESQNGGRDVRRAGHVMFMHCPDVNVRYVAFHNLGRTDKRKAVNDPKLDGKKKLVPGTGTNPRGRYAVHFHRTGTNAKGCPAVVQGSVVLGSPGWGFVNHSSYVEFEDNVAFNVAGAAFVTEAGDEIGIFRGNLAIRSTGSGEDVDSRRRLQDFGHGGDGFWFQGGGVSVENNIAAGQAQTGFIFFTTGLVQEGLGKMRFDAANLKDASWARGKATVEVGQVPTRSFTGNVVFASHTGIVPRFHLSGLKDGGPQSTRSSVLKDSTVWNTRVGVHIRYSARITLRNLRLVGNPDPKEHGQAGVLGQIEEVNNIRCENLRVQGWRAGVDVRESGSWVIDGGNYDNEINIFIPTTIERGRVIKITGDIRFAEPARKTAGHYDVYLSANFSTLLQGRSGYRNPNHLFVPDVIEYQDKQLYYLEQAADHVPLRKKLTQEEKKRLGTAEGSVPEELIGKTNRALWEQYGLAIAGTVAPADAKTQPRIHGLVGSKASYRQPEIVYHEHVSAALKGFKLICFGAGKKRVAETEPVDLRPGWNLLTLTIKGHRRSFLVHGGKALSSGKAYQKGTKK
jgi:hypothetical protein